MARKQQLLTPVGDRGHAVTQSGETVVGRFTPTGRDKGTAYKGTPMSGVGPRAMSNRRQAWEESTAGQARTAKPLGDNPGMAHFMRSYDHQLVGPTHYDEQLPGMSDPNAAPRPPKWHELTGEQQRAAKAGARAHGTSLDKMVSDVGAHLDQAVVEAASFGHSRGYTEDFYGSGDPRKVIDRSADELGVPRTIHAQMNALTSPQSKFSTTNTETGEIRYPNNETATHAVRHVQHNKTAKMLSSDLSTTGTGEGGAAGYMANTVKAARSFDQYQRGVKPSDWVTNKAGNAGPFESSPKTGPYANSWNDTHPQFTVSDVHTGGGGFLPHLGSEKRAKLDSSGRPAVDSTGHPIAEKSEREAAISSIPHFHTMADHAMRTAMAQRNMPSVRDAQALQWGQERLDRKRQSNRFDGPTPSEAYGAGSRTSQRQVPGQSHFEGMAHYEDEGPSRKIARKQTKGQESLF